MNLKVTLVILFSVLFCARADIYSVIVAGSNGFSNYRHQADTCHAYKLLIANGVKPENIVLMAYNDIAFNIENPLQGELHNAPSGDKPGQNFYDGCVIDYQGRDVNKANYRAVLLGDKEGTTGGNGRVLNSGPNDEVFLVYSDHGSLGFVSLPNPDKKPSAEVYLYADELLEILQEMHDKERYQTLTYYMNACHSGSMFQDLPDDINVYAMTAANSSQSGWGCFCPPGGDKVRSVYIDACLSSQFPASWLYNTELFDTNTESLETQFQLVKTTTTKSEVQNWGTKEFIQWPISKFVGGENQENKIIGATLMQRIFSFYEKVKDQVELFKGMTENVEEQRHIETNYIMRKYKQNPSQENYKKLSEILTQNSKFDKIFHTFKAQYQLEEEFEGKTDFNCYRSAIASLENQCGVFNDYGYQFAKYLYQYCAKNATLSEELVFNC